MSFTRLGESVQTLYAELLDQLRAADAEAALGGLRGTFVSKQIRGRTYWYLQQSAGATKRQIYLGPDSPELLERMQAASEQRTLVEADQARRREIVRMLEAGGMFRESAAVGTVLRVLAGASVFRAGGVLVGTQAFTCIANLLGVSFERESLRTADVDIAHDTRIPLGLSRAGEDDLLARLREQDPGFFAVPGLDARQASTSFKVRGRDLRVDFLTPANRRPRDDHPILLAHLGVAAQPLVNLDYVIEETVDAAVVTGGGIRVNIPTPARFAFHKLWLTGERPISEIPKAKKDFRQGEQLLEVLVGERPDDVVDAWKQLAGRKSMVTGVRKALRQLPSPLQAGIRRLLDGA